MIPPTSPLWNKGKGVLILLLDVKEQFACKVENVLSPLTEKQDNESDNTQKSLTPWNRF